ncbi:MAG: DNA repair protein RecO [Oscillospiraceae bacterium]|nr:DNA repair protein RecO [Oscillospiraceae bacterium]
MYETVKGIILRETQYKDADKILSLLTAERGLVTVKARGVQRSKSLNKSACQLLTYSEFQLYERQGYYTITEAQPIMMFRQLREDMELLALGSYFAQAAEVLAQEDAPNPELLSLLLHALNALCAQKPQMLVKGAFELRLAAIAGYEPDLSGCASCGEEATRFDITNGELLCANCGGSGLKLPVSPGTLSAMRYILTAEIGRVFSFSLSDGSIKQLSDVSEAYLLMRLERGFFTLDFYKSLFLT